MLRYPIKVIGLGHSSFWKSNSPELLSLISSNWALVFRAVTKINTVVCLKSGLQKSGLFRFCEKAPVQNIRTFRLLSYDLTERVIFKKSGFRESIFRSIIRRSPFSRRICTKPMWISKKIRTFRFKKAVVQKVRTFGFSQKRNCPKIRSFTKNPYTCESSF